MSTFKVKLSRSNPFWRMADIYLTEDRPVSKYMDTDKLTSVQLKTIKNSARTGSIIIIGDIDDVTPAEVVVVEVEKEEVAPEVASVTVSLEEEDETPAEEETVDVDALQAQAISLVSNNSATVKDTIASIDTDENESFAILSACLKAEKENKDRSGVIKVIENAIKEC